MVIIMIGTDIYNIPIENLLKLDIFIKIHILIANFETTMFFRIYVMCSIMK
jgi:hypothetical protein